MNLSISPEQKLTPMMEQYRSIKKTLPQNTVLFFRLGDFYEMFFEDAVRASEILNITLTGREGGEAGRIPMCGIPYHASPGYVRTLIDNNLKVAICEQVGDPKAGKGLVERKITRIISPATYLEDETEGKNPEYMVSVAVDGSNHAIAYLDLGTGEFYVREVGADRLTSELTLLAPREVILPKSAAQNVQLATFAKDSLNATLTVYEDWVFEKDECVSLLKDNFKLASEKGIPFHDHPLAVRAAGSILYYLRDHLHSSLGHVRIPLLLGAGEFMILDRQAQRSLELVSSLSGQKNGPTLLSCIDQTLTSMGGRALYQWIIRPLLNAEEILKRQESIQEFIQNQNMLQTLRGLFKGVKDMERTLSRLNYGVANARDFENLKIFLSRVPEILAQMAPAKSALLNELRAAVKSFPELHKLIDESILEAPPLSIKDGGIIRDGYCKDLDELREISKNGKSWILEFERRESERTGIKSLKVKYSHVFGYALEISKSNLHMVPSDYIRRQTLANAERFVVPELKTWDEKISGAEDKIKALEYQLFNEIRAKVLEQLAPLQQMAHAMGDIDALGSLAVTALQRRWVRPEIVNDSSLEIKNGRHPVVEAMLPSGQFVENDTLLDGAENQLIVLTGPNMAGKSTYIRQVAQIVLLAQIGSFVPAASAKVGLADRIFTRIGSSDNLAQGESTFMVEMLEMASILRTATSKSLLVLDEVGRGTATFDGVSIAWAFCEFLVQGKAKPRTLFATHYHELSQLEEHFPRIKNYHITVKETKDSIVFLRKVVRGGADRSYGIHVARLAGIPDVVTKRAAEILTVLESENTEATQIIEGRNKTKKKKDFPQQTTFFDQGSAPEKENPLLEEIKNFPVDNLTPIAALNKINEWRQKLNALSEIES